jgi:hypothetical protein
MQLLKPKLFKSKLSDFFINVSASYFITMFASLGFLSNDLFHLSLNFIFYSVLAIMYFIFSIIIFNF